MADGDGRELATGRDAYARRAGHRTQGTHPGFRADNSVAKEGRHFLHEELCVRILLSSELKRAIPAAGVRQGSLGQAVGPNQVQIARMLHDRLPLGPRTRAKIVRLGALLGVPAAACFREVRRG